LTSLQAFGAAADGQADDTAAFRAAAASGSEIVVPKGRYRLAAKVAFAAPVRFDHGAVIEAASGTVIRFGGGVVAGPHQIFAFSDGARAEFDPAVTSVAYPEWWGARPGDAGFDCQPAIQAALRACPRTVLQGGDYYIGSTLKILDHGHSLEGVAPTQEGHKGSTRLMLASGTADGLQVGFDRSPGDAKRWLEHARVSDLTVQRVARIENPASGFADAPCGVRLQWAVTCTLERVETLEHSHGFYITGTVHCYLRHCQALRYAAGAVRANDFFNGFFMDNSAASGFNSGNASLYIQNCSTFSTQAVPFSESSGIKSHAGFTDTFITGFECALVGYGLNMNGRGSRGVDYQTEDLIVDNCVLDSPTSVGILITGGSKVTAAQIHNSYIAPAGPGVAIAVRDCGGAVGITGCQIISTPGNTATGLEVTRASGVSAMNNIFTDLQNPVVIREAADCRVMDTINNVTQKVAKAAVRVEALDRGWLAPIVTGSEGHSPAGVSLEGKRNAGVEINCTGIRASAIAGGRVNILLADGATVAGPGPFIGGNLASGIMG
ncbi:MAG: hypothetical protein JWO83_481, partial [Caulobacteraceae bacterium]|nr:hypothetical protein [Caulobacteraceae bacterium]